MHCREAARPHRSRCWSFSFRVGSSYIGILLKPVLSFCDLGLCELCRSVHRTFMVSWPRFLIRRRQPKHHGRLPSKLGSWRSVTFSVLRTWISKESSWHQKNGYLLQCDNVIQIFRAKENLSGYAAQMHYLAWCWYVTCYLGLSWFSGPVIGLHVRNPNSQSYFKTV